MLACELLGTAPARAQMSGSGSLWAKLTSIFANLDKSQIPTGNLFEAAPKILDLRRYNGTLNDTNRTDADMLRYLRLLTRSARLYGADTLPTLSAYNAQLPGGLTFPFPTSRNPLLHPLPGSSGKKRLVKSD